MDRKIVTGMDCASYMIVIRTSGAGIKPSDGCAVVLAADEGAWGGTERQEKARSMSPREQKTPRSIVRSVDAKIQSIRIIVVDAASSPHPGRSEAGVCSR